MDLEAVEGRIVRCRRCPRLVSWREEAAAGPPRRLRGERCRGRPGPGVGRPRPRPRVGHEALARVGPYRLVGCFHPSQQNTFTGKLTEAMLDSAIALALAG